MMATIDALWRNYKVILLYDCTLVNDFPEEQAELLGTQRMVKMLESQYCVSVTTPEFIAATRIFATGNEQRLLEGCLGRRSRPKQPQTYLPFTYPEFTLV